MGTDSVFFALLGCLYQNTCQGLVLACARLQSQSQAAGAHGLCLLPKLSLLVVPLGEVGPELSQVPGGVPVP